MHINNNYGNDNNKENNTETSNAGGLEKRLCRK